MGFCIPPQAPLHFLLPFIPPNFSKFTKQCSSFREDLPVLLQRMGARVVWIIPPSITFYDTVPHYNIPTGASVMFDKYFDFHICVSISLYSAVLMPL